MSQTYQEHEKVELSDYLANPAKALEKIARRECERIAIVKNDKLLFWGVSQDNVLSVVSGLLKSREEKKAASPIKIDTQNLSFKNLTPAQEQLLKIRQKFDFFKNMSDDDSLRVTSDVNFLRLKRGEVIFEQASIGKEIYFIMSGGVEISVSGEKGGGAVQKYAERIPLVVLKQEQIFGEMAPITNEPRSARATATSDTTMLLSFKISEEITQENSMVFNSLYQNFLGILASKVRQANQMLYDNRKK